MRSYVGGVICIGAESGIGDSGPNLICCVNLRTNATGKNMYLTLLLKAMD